MAAKYFELNGRCAKVVYREYTSDEACLTEVIDQGCYARCDVDFLPKEGETWLDLGANIGAFAVWAKLHGAVCHCYEPVPHNFQLLRANVGTYRGFRLINSAVTASRRATLPFFLGSNPGDHYRASIIVPATQRKVLQLPNLHVSEVDVPEYHLYGGIAHPLKGFDGVKMDIEGAEFGIIDQGLIPPCNKLVMEYHLSKDPDMAHFRKRIRLLKKRFRNVYYIESMNQQYKDDQYPGFFDRFIWCWEAK